MPISSIESANITQESNGSLTLGFKPKRTKFISEEVTRAFTSCEPAEEIEAFLATLVDANPSITVNNVDMKAEVSRLQQAQMDAANEIIGIDRRVTLTRLALGGVVGGLLFKKREVVRRKDL